MITLEQLKVIEEANTARKTIKRKWKTKAGWNYKEYVYAESELLFRKTKKGYKVIDKAWKEFEESIKQKLPNQATGIINQARAIRNDILQGNEVGKYGFSTKQYASARQKGWNRIDVKSMISRLSSNEVEKFFANMGITPTEVVQYVLEKYNRIIDITDLLNPGRWKNDTWQGVDAEGRAIELVIEFSYDGVTGIQVR